MLRLLRPLRRMEPRKNVTTIHEVSKPDRVRVRVALSLDFRSRNAPKGSN